MAIISAGTLLITNIVWPEGKSTKTISFWFVGLIIPMSLMLLAFGFSFFLKKLTEYNNHILTETFGKDTEKWQEYQSAFLPVRKVIIIGSLGYNQYQWSVLLSGKPLPPAPVSENGKMRLNCPVLVGKQENRENMLAKLLANELYQSLGQEETVSVSRIYWSGSFDSMTAFIAQLSSKGISVPPSGKVILSVNELDEIIDDFYRKTYTGGSVLFAGTNLSDITDQTLAETGFLWLIDPEHTCRVYRCEEMTLNEDDPEIVANQVTGYAGSDSPPDITLAMDAAGAGVFLSTILHGSENIISAYYGDITGSSPFIAITQALAQSVSRNGNTCGWISGASGNKYIAGVVSKNENTKHE
ncbi:hypothetical protein L9H26_00090 [Morganella psychrotolerans]|uniref:Uncharacterized protein n=1 Tax=Morganella psychrotolerans TaxID=368603 RepID=A0A5M9QZZ9_9GAMM|nr:hypothetical protein [Morganella psychrotolerans]KAA8713587.1 hypothetical protein F4V73_16765 [Morganella psychrotolerans]